MRTGSIEDVIDVLKSLNHLSKSKNLSFREKRMLDRAKFLVVSEISEVMGEPDEDHPGPGREGARSLPRQPRAAVGPGEGGEAQGCQGVDAGDQRAGTRVVVPH